MPWAMLKLRFFWRGDWLIRQSYLTALLSCWNSSPPKSWSQRRKLRFGGCRGRSRTNDCVPGLWSRLRPKCLLKWPSPFMGDNKPNAGVSAHYSKPETHRSHLEMFCGANTNRDLAR